jgi:hypothetical protein
VRFSDVPAYSSIFSINGLFDVLFIINYLAWSIQLSRVKCKAAFVHLKSLIVRPAVLRVLAPLNRSLKHRNWAGLTEYTRPFGIALGYVFDKQSGSPCHCDLLMHSKIKHNYRHPFYRRYGTRLPNSLNQIVLSRLSLLSLGTSASSWYGHL